ncbi:LytTR family DNA-binding domain-containing protein [Secundilactobacillus paracollinoides]|uniref:LytTR family DNA-binding domain-containing protein n=1 Tax=Secundilactobacillus paracollinoides TaxID=240427 RepID=UPI0021E7453A|nr:LytTR family DNA-binding domain-containing protein [Secundilactobacillus paracollinoides]
MPATFMRISKSAILNTTKIFALTHSISNSLVEFQHSQKQVYVSRKYYKPLKARLEERR